LGARTHWHFAIDHAGLLLAIRYPEKFGLVASFALLTYGAVVLDAILKGRGDLARRAAWFCGIVGLCGAIVFVACLRSGYTEWFSAFWHVTDAGAASIARTQWLVAAIRGAAFAFALMVLANDTGRKAILLFVLFLVADLAPLSNQINPRIDRSYFDTPPAIVNRLDRRGSRVAHVAGLQQALKESKEYFSSGERTYWVLKNGLWPYTAALWGIPTCLEYDVDETQLMQTREMLTVVEKIAKRGVQSWMVVVGPMYGSGPALIFRDPAKELARIGTEWAKIEPVEIDELPRYPRYFFASAMVEAPDVARLTDLLATRAWSPTTAFVCTGARPVARGTILAAREFANRTVVDVVAEGNAFLVLCSTHDRHWRATIDGKPAPIVGTHLAFQGIEIPRGRHRVELHCRNPSNPIGGLQCNLALTSPRPLRRLLGSPQGPRTWPTFGGGGHPTRDTLAAIEAAGFTVESCERFPFSPSPAVPRIPHILGMARAGHHTV